LIAKSALDHRIVDIIEPTVNDMGLELIRVRLMGGETPILQIMAEKPNGTMEIEACAELSRALSALLDVEDPIESEYNLEVSSPGMDRPLTRLKDVEAYAGFEAKLELNDAIHTDQGSRKRFRGILLGLKDENIILRMPDGSDEALPFDSLSDARLVLTDALIAESLRRQKASGAFAEDTEFDELEYDDDTQEDGVLNDDTQNHTGN